MTWLVLGLLTAAVVPAGLRWLRVAQREHYLAGSVRRFAYRWWTLLPWNPPLALLGAGGAVAAGWWTPAGVVTAAAVAVGPLGLSIRGTSAPLAWTSRLRRLGAAAIVIAGLAVLVGSVLVPPVMAVALVALVVPFLVDAAASLMARIEARLASGWVRRAAATLAQEAPRVVAITGSYGKTTTKEYVRHLVSASSTVVASPASFNNAMGLARTVNEHLVGGTEVFVAEMGTYGPGEIAGMCRWVRPEVAVITAIGPVHLERFGSLDAVLTAKAEILAEATVAVLNVDDGRLAALAERSGDGRRVIRCSTVQEHADVLVRPTGDALEVFVEGRPVGRVEDSSVFASNLACAVGAVHALGVRPQDLTARFAGLPTPDHRQQSFVGEGGFEIIDDTYNSNPAGVRVALEKLRVAGAAEGRRVVVTPGMVELGPRQHDENVEFGRLAAGVADQIVIVGRTNRRALRQGAEAGQGSVIVVPTRSDAVAWVRGHLGPGDVVLYENDLPDHYP